MLREWILGIRQTLVQILAFLPTSCVNYFNFVSLSSSTYKNRSIRITIGWASWLMPVITTLCEAEVGGSPEVGSLRPA